MQTILVIMIIKLILICLSNSFFNFFIKMKSEKRTAFRFLYSYENEKQMKVLKIQRKNLLNIRMVVSYLNFVFLIEVKAKFKYRIFKFRYSIYQKHEITLWVPGLMMLIFSRKIFYNQVQTFSDLIWKYQVHC